MFSFSALRRSWSVERTPCVKILCASRHAFLAVVSLEWTGTLVLSRNKALGMLLSIQLLGFEQHHKTIHVSRTRCHLYEMLSAEEGSIYSGTPYMQSILIPCTDFSMI